MRKILLLIFTVMLVPGLFAQGLNSVSSSGSNNVLAVGNSGKIFRTITGGSGWSSYTINPTVNYKSIAQAGNYYFISGDNGKVYKTTVSDLILTEFTTGISTSLNSINFLDSLNGFACGANGVIIKTTNGGTNWTAINSGISNIRLNSVSFKNALNGVVAGDGGVMYLTTNGGTNWTLQTSLTTKNLLDARYYNEGVVIAGEYGIIIRKDNAGSFLLKVTKTKSDIRSISGTYANNHVCGGGGFIRNNKNGSDNYFNFEINPMMANLVDIVYADSLTGYAISSLNDAIIKTTNGGDIWTLTAGTTASISWVSKLVTTSGIGNNLCMHPTDRNSLFVMYGNRVYVSRDKAETWTQIATTSLGTSTHSFYVSPLDTNIWVAAIESSTDKVIRTTDYGVTWSTILSQNFSNYGQPLEMDQNNPSTFYFAPDGGGFYKSTDVGLTFTEISGMYPFRSPCDLIVMYDSSNVIFLADGVTGSGLGEIFKSSNGGVNWSKVHTNTSSSEIPALANSVFDKSTMYATNWSGGNIYKTTNFGDNWVLFRTNTSSGWGEDICKEDPTLVLTGSYGPATFLSTDNGANFSSYSSGGGAGAGMIVPDRSYLINMMTGGLQKMNISYSVVTEVNENIISSITPKSFSLQQNYPNPFNPTTKIKYDLPKSGTVKLSIYDNLGREIRSIVNGFKNAGVYEINFDGSKLSTGVYFYRLTTSEFSETKRMLLIK
jgi:photosystem II stability/assembly factor-like uncharacterized protein